MRTLDLIQDEYFDMDLARDVAPRQWRSDDPDPEDDAALLQWVQEARQRKHEHERLREEQVEVLAHGLLMNEVDYVQFTGRKDEQGKTIRVHYWQSCMLLDNIVVAYCGRDVGKSTSLKWCLDQRSTNYPTGSVIITGNQDDRVKKVWNETIMREQRMHWWSRHFFDNRDGASSTRNPYHQWYANGFMCYGRPAGKNTSHKVESPHCAGVLGDEHQEFDWLVWEKLQPAILDYETNVVHGAMLKFFGVNSQGRTDNVFYHLAHKDPLYKHHRYTFASWLNPKYSLGVHMKYLSAYDMSVHSSRFKQMIRGLVGERSRGLIPPQSYHACCAQGSMLDHVEPKVLKVEKVLWVQCGQEPEHLFTNRFHLEPYTGEHSMRVLTMDYGSSNPSEIGIWYRVLNPDPLANDDNREIWLLWQRISLIGIQGNEQAMIVHYLDGFYGCEYLSVDSTGATDVISQLLTDPTHPVYAERGYRKRLFPAKSNGFIPIRYELEEPEDRGLAPAGTKWQKVELASQDGAYSLTVWAMVQNSNVFSSYAVGQMFQARLYALAGGDRPVQDELLNIVEQIKPGIQPVFVGGGGQHVFSMFRSHAQWFHHHFTLRKLRQRLLQEDEDEYYGGWGQPMVACGQVRQTGTNEDGGYSSYSSTTSTAALHAAGMYMERGRSRSPVWGGSSYA